MAQPIQSIRIEGMTGKEQELYDAITNGMDEAGCGWLHELNPFENDHVCAGVLSSLIKKGFVQSDEDREGPEVCYWVTILK